MIKNVRSLTMSLACATAGTALFMQPTPSHAELPPLIPLRDFFRNPEASGYQISPDGTYLAFRKPWENRMNIHVARVGEPLDSAVRVTGATERDIAGYFWANNGRIAYIQDTGGDENFRLYAVDADGSDQKDLTPFEAVRIQIIDDLEDNPEEMIIGMNERNKEIHDAYRLHIVTGDLEMIVENPGTYSGYLTDHDGKLRIATATDGVETSILYRPTEDDPFETVLTTDFKETLAPLFFTYDNSKVYASSNLGRDKSAIIVWDPATATEEEVIYQHPEVDVATLLRSDKRKTITGVAYMTDKRGYEFFDDARRKMQEFLESELPDQEVSLVDFSKDESTYLVRAYTDRSLGTYYYYIPAEEKLEKIADISPWLNPDHLAEMVPVHYQSRDGLTIHGYLTLPVGVAPEKLPVVVNPHGGPWARDHWGFNPEAQFLANRGYAVFSMNFRGSTGYGREFWEASFKEWGKSMQDDVTDGVRWLIEQGTADPERIAIYGASYGGYATLAGMVFTPGLYACGVDYVGVSNLLTFMDGIPPYWEQYRQMMYEMVGNPETEKEMLEAASPVFHVDKIEAPLFIAQGANDPRVVKSESDQMVEALRERGIEVPYMVKDNEGHGFQNEENRFDFYRAMEQFLAKHLGGRKEDAPPAIDL
ncbi:S9 family peptidase [soil metagenome]